MKKTNLFLTLIVASAVITGISGCGPNEKKSLAKDISDEEIAEMVTPDIPIDESPLYDLYQKADELLIEGNTNAANALFIDALGDAEFKQLKSPLFNTMIRYFIFTDQIEMAKEQYLNALRTSPEIAKPGFDTIYGAYMSARDFEGALDWARVLATQDIGEDLRMTATDWLIASLFRNGKFDEMDEEIKLAIERFDAVRFAPLLGRVGLEVLVSGNITVAEKMLALIEASSKGDTTSYLEILTTMQVRIDAEKGHWEKILARMPALLSDVKDQPLQQAIGHAFQSARRAKRFDMIEAMASAIVHSEQAADAMYTRFVAASEWIRVLFDGNEPDLPSFPVRLDTLMNRGVPAQQVYMIYSQHFYALINDPEVLKACIPVVDQLLPMLTDQALQDGLRVYQLDACFIVDDYDRALEILEKGIVKHDEDWHKTAIVKVKAHRAQKEGRYEDAVGFYRQFMGTIKDKNIADPATDVVYSRSTLLGNNEKRIGDIYSEAGKADEAVQAYTAAREWYEQALELNEAGEATADYIRKQIEAIPETAADADKSSELAEAVDIMSEESVEAVPAP